MIFTNNVIVTKTKYFHPLEKKGAFILQCGFGYVFTHKSWSSLPARDPFIRKAHGFTHLHTHLHALTYIAFHRPGNYHKQNVKT